VVREIGRRAFLAGSLGAIVAACTSGDDDGSAAPTAPEPSEPSAAPEPTATGTSPATTPPETTAPVPSGPALPADPFRLGVASGDPTPTSAMLWTRLAPEPLAAAGGMPPEPVEVTWQVMADAEGEEWEDIVAEGTVVADPANAHAVHIDADGLESGTWYRYRFSVGTWASPVGRTRTAPAPGDGGPLVIGQASCQDWQDGYYAAHRDIATAGVDLLVFLGDYIYEGAALPVGGEIVRSHEGPEPTTLDGYRTRYALYKSDPDLQAAHAACPWVVAWDDHEVDNDYAAELDQDGGDPQAFRERRAAAYRAWWEHQPVRLPRPAGADLQTFRRVELGALASILLLDGRQYRSDQACGSPDASLDPPCPEITAPGRTMLGTEQETWLAEELAGVGAAWTVIANQTVLTDLRLGTAVLNYDQWDGYPDARARLLAELARRPERSAVVLTGDIHLGGAGLVTPAGGAPVATELVCTSISSRGLEPVLESLFGAFPDVVYADLQHRGWTRHAVSAQRWEAEFRVVEDPTDPGSVVRVGARFALRPDHPEIVRIEA
jgi:alkaline phosphatase D